MAGGRYRNPDRFFLKLGEKVKGLRQGRGWTQEDMMDHGFGLRFYQRIEAGKPIHMRTVLKLADTFGVSLEHLFRGL